MWMIAYQSTRLVGRHRGTLPVVLTQPDARGELLPILLPITALMPFSVSSGNR